MKTISKFIAITAFSVTATAAQAQLYGEVGYTSLKVKATYDDDKYKASPNVLGVTVGYDVHENASVEAMGVFGVNQANIKVNGTSVPAKLIVNSSYGVFLKPKAMLNESFEIFGRLGYMNSKVSITGAGLSGSETNNGFAYGLGSNYYVTKTTYLTVNYMKFYDKNKTKVDGITFGLGMKF